MYELAILVLIVFLMVLFLAVAGLERCLRPLEAIHEDFPHWILKDEPEGLLFKHCP